MMKTKPSPKEIKAAKELLEARALRLVESKIIQKAQVVASVLGRFHSEWTADFDYEFDDITISHDGSGFYHGCDEIAIYYSREKVLNASEDPGYFNFGPEKYPSIILDEDCKNVSDFDHFWIDCYKPGNWEDEILKLYDSLSEKQRKSAARGNNSHDYVIGTEFKKETLRKKPTLEELELLHDRFDEYKFLGYYGI